MRSPLLAKTGGRTGSRSLPAWVSHHKCVSLDGINDHLVATGLEQVYHDTTAFTVGILFRSVDTGTYLMNWVRSSAGSLNQIRWSIALNGGQPRARFTIRDDTATAFDHYVGSKIPSASDFQWWWVTDDNGSISLYWDREASAYATGSYSRAAFVKTMDAAAIGCYYAGGSPSANCEADIAQVVAFPRVLTQAERFYMHDTYNQRWKHEPRHLYLMGDAASQFEDMQKSGSADADLTPAGGLALADIANLKHEMSA